MARLRKLLLVLGSAVLLSVAGFLGFTNWSVDQLTKINPAADGFQAPVPVLEPMQAELPEELDGAASRADSGRDASPASAGIDEGTSKLRDWLQRYEIAAPEERESLLAEGIRIASRRRATLLEMFPLNPENVLAQSLSLDEHARAPEVLSEFLEKPFSAVVDYTRIPVCPGNAGSKGTIEPARQLVPNQMTLVGGERLKVYATGARREIGSKRDLPVQGVALNGMAVMRDGVFQRLSPEDLPVAESRYGSAQENPSLSFATGKAITGEPVRALAGGKLFSFESEKELLEFDRAVARLDVKPGPRSGSRLIFALPYQANGGTGGFNLEAAEFTAAAASADWTCSPKKVFLIRVDFSDKPGEPISKNDAETALNGKSAAAILEMSYAKTSITGTVSANVYRMPKPSTAYAGTVAAGSSSFTSLNTDLLRDAKECFRSLKSGLDAAVNIGDSNANYGTYDVVGVYFSDIGAYNAGVKYAGLATLGKGDLWMQGSNDPKVYVHEFGHIYGLGHSNFWLTTDQTSVGAGSEKEYGDIYDVMGSGELPQAHFHPHAKSTLFWLRDDQCDLSDLSQTARTLRLYRIDSAIPADEATAKLRGIRIKKSTVASESEYYWIGYRGAYTENQYLSRGAYLLWQRLGKDNCCLIDSMPATVGDKADAALHVGRTYSDPGAQVHITPISIGGTAGNEYIDLQINRGGFAGNAGPVLTQILASPNPRARNQIVFEAPATDADGDELAYFWSFSDGTIAGGTGASASSITHSFIVGGSQTVTVTVSDMKGGTTLPVSTTLYVSDPALTFTGSASASGTNGDLLGIASNGVLMVAVGTVGSSADKAVIRTSSDGVVWTSRSVVESTLNLKLRAVHWSGERFVAVGTDADAAGKWVGVIYTSENGVSWTRRYTGTQSGTGLHCVFSGNGAYVAGGEGGVLLYSRSGVNWEALNLLPSTHKAAGVTFGAGTFVLTAHRYDSTTGSGEAKVFASPDARNWTDYTSGSGIDASWQDLRAIAFLNDRFVASGWKSKLRVSTDGGKTFSTTRSVSEDMRAFSYQNGLYFASGFEAVDSGASSQKKWLNLYSVDGVNWARVDAAYSKTAGAVAFGGRIVTVAEGGLISKSEPLQSNTPSNPPARLEFSIPESVKARSKSSFTVEAFDQNGSSLSGGSLSYSWDAGDGFGVGGGSEFNYGWLIGGSYDLTVTVSDGSGGSVTGKREIFVDDPLKGFQQSSIASHSLNSIAANGSLAVAVGESGEITTSNDGVLWTSRSVTESTLNLHLYSVHWTGERFVAAGMDASAGGKWVGVIYTSNDGIAWTRRYTGIRADTDLRCIASGSGACVVGGRSGALLYSMDFVNWEVLDLLPSTHRFAGVAFGAGAFVLNAHRYDSTAGSGSARVFASPDGRNWTDYTSGSGIDASWQDLRAIAFLNDRFVASGWHSKLKVSTDEGSSFRSVLAEDRDASAVVFGNGVYLGISEDYSLEGGQFQSPLHFVSVDGERWVQTAAQSILTKSKSAVFFKDRFLVVGQSGLLARSGTIESALTVPSILVQPVGGKFSEGTPLRLCVEAGGSPPLSYQWKKNGADIPGAISASYEVLAAGSAHAGDYQVAVYGSGASVDSRAVSVQVVSNPIANDDSIVVVPGRNELDVRGNDSDHDGSNQGIEISSFTPFAPVAGGVLSLVAGTLTFVPSSSFAGGSFTYAIQNGSGGQATAKVQLTPATESISARSGSFAASGGIGRIVINAFGESRILNLPSWVSCVTESGGEVAGIKRMIFTVSANRWTQPRSAAIRIGSLSYAVFQDADPQGGLTYPGMAGLPLKIGSLSSGTRFYIAGRLPAGLSLNRNTGEISGTPLSPVVSTVQLRWVNADGTLGSKEMNFQVEAFSPTLTGQYTGLVEKNSMLNDDLGARVDCVVSSAGRVSGRVSSPFGRAAFRGSLHTTLSEPTRGDGAFALDFGGGLEATLSLQIDGQQQILSGSINLVESGTSAAVSGWRNPWDKVQATSFAGRYHFYLQNAEQSSVPVGYGYGAAAVSKFRGGVTIWGRLPDSSGMLSSAFLSKDGEVLVYSSLYTGGGSCVGVLSIDKGVSPPTENSIRNSTSKPISWTKNEASLRDLKVVPQQFEGVKLGVQGAIFNPSDSLISRSSLVKSTAGSLSFTPSSADSAVPAFTKDISFYAIGGVQVRVIVPSNLSELEVTPIRPSDGLFSGVFSVPSEPPSATPYRARFSGQIVNIGSQSIGYGFFLAPTKSPSFQGAGLRELISGTVTLSQP